MFLIPLNSNVFLLSSILPKISPLRNILEVIEYISTLTGRNVRGTPIYFLIKSSAFEKVILV